MILNRIKYVLFLVGAGVILAACGAITSDVGSESETASTEKQVETVANEVPMTADEAAVEATVPDAEENLLTGMEPVEIERDPDVPPLPFPDNPDPALCGIPQPWNSDTPAYLNGIYEGELLQPIVFLYDSHLRRKIVAEAPHGTEVKIILSQSNPELNYFMVKIVGADSPNEGWVPAPFVSFEPPPTDI